MADASGRDTSHEVTVRFVDAPAGLRNGITRADGDARLSLRTGDLDAARAALAESLKLKPAMNSLARRRADVPWIANPPYWALQEKTLNVGLRRVGFPDE
jgi:hypothetical protein